MLGCGGRIRGDKIRWSMDSSAWTTWSSFTPSECVILTQWFCSVSGTCPVYSSFLCLCALFPYPQMVLILISNFWFLLLTLQIFPNPWSLSTPTWTSSLPLFYVLFFLLSLSLILVYTIKTLVITLFSIEVKCEIMWALYQDCLHFSLSSSVAHLHDLGKLLNFSVPQFPHR